MGQRLKQRLRKDERLGEKFWHNDTDFNLIFSGDGFQGEKVYLCFSSFHLTRSQTKNSKIHFSGEKAQFKLFVSAVLGEWVEMKIDNR